MKNLYIYCEGQTEKSFINQILYPYLFNIGICAIPIICTTKRTKAEKFRGGVNNYQKIRNELLILCKQHIGKAQEVPSRQGFGTFVMLSCFIVLIEIVGFGAFLVHDVKKYDMLIVFIR